LDNTSASSETLEGLATTTLFVADYLGEHLAQWTLTSRRALTLSHMTTYREQHFQELQLDSTGLIR